MPSFVILHHSGTKWGLLESKKKKGPIKSEIVLDHIVRDPFEDAQIVQNLFAAASKLLPGARPAATRPSLSCKARVRGDVGFNTCSLEKEAKKQAATMMELRGLVLSGRIYEHQAHTCR